MPPANSPSEPRADYVPPTLSRSSSAANIHNPSAGDDVHDENVSFLRYPISRSSYSSLSNPSRRRRQQNATDYDTEPMDLDDPANPFETHRRMRIIHRRQEEMANVPNYETTNDTQSLYGWAPSPDNDDSERGESRRNNDTLNAWHRTLASRHPSLRNHLEEADRNSPLPDETANNEPDPFTLTAVETLFQAVRRQPRFNRARALQNYLSERDPQPRQSQTQNHSPNRPYRLLSNRGSPSDWPRGCPHSYRRSQMGGQDRPRLKDAIRYLHKLQYADSYKDSLDYAVNFGFTPNDNPTSGNQDLVLDTASITLPTECSWLRPGMVFSGSQKAAHSAASIYSRRMPGQNSLFHYIDNRDSLNGRLRDENWPVKVTIHDINYEDMTLSGTMEAYNIPDKTYPSHDAHIVTFLEGEIIDFNTHTLETMNFKSSVEVDSTYWRQLHPFKGLTDDDELVSSLVSRKWINEQLAEHWVLMRWKERCFITPTDSRQGLTISGFYYIVLRRDNGQIDGLYYDPGSSPYQQLTLRPEKYTMVRPSYKFR